MFVCSSTKLVQVQRGVGRNLETSLPCPSDSEPAWNLDFSLSATALCFRAFTTSSSSPVNLGLVSSSPSVPVERTCVHLSLVTGFQELLLTG